MAGRKVSLCRAVFGYRTSKTQSRLRDSTKRNTANCCSCNSCHFRETFPEEFRTSKTYRAANFSRASKRHKQLLSHKLKSFQIEWESSPFSFFSPVSQHKQTGPNVTNIPGVFWLPPRQSSQKGTGIRIKLTSNVVKTIFSMELK